MQKSTPPCPIKHARKDPICDRQKRPDQPLPQVKKEANPSTNQATDRDFIELESGVELLLCQLAKRLSKSKQNQPIR